MPVPVMPSPPRRPKARGRSHTRGIRRSTARSRHWSRRATGSASVRLRSGSHRSTCPRTSSSRSCSEELADPDHPHHDAIGCIAVVLGDEGVLRARDAAVRLGRLTRSAWEFWTGRAGRDARGEDTSRLRFRVR